MRLGRGTESRGAIAAIVPPLNEAAHLPRTLEVLKADPGIREIVRQHLRHPWLKLRFAWTRHLGNGHVV